MKPTALLPFLLTFALFMGCSKDESKPIPEEPDTVAPEVMFQIAGLPNDNPPGGGDGSADTTSVIVPNIIVIEISAQDARGVEKVEAFVDGEKAGEDLTDPFSITIDFSTIQAKGIVLSKSETQYTLKITATDLSGNQSSVEQRIVVDGEMPVISDVSLAPDTYLKGDSNAVEFVVIDNEALNEITARVDDMEIPVVASDSSGYLLNLNTLEIADGAHQLTIKAIDMAANEALYQVPFTSDNTAPVAGITSITTGSDPEALKSYTRQALDTMIPVITNTATFELGAEDAVGIAHVELFVNNVLAQKDSVSPYEIAIDLNNYLAKSGQAQKSDTLIDIKVKVYDMVAQTDSLIQQAYVDNIKPVISGLSLKNKQGLKGSENPVTFSASDNHQLESLVVEIDGNLMETAVDTSAYSLNIDTSNLSDGWHNFTVKARDEAYNITTTTLEFLSDNTGPEVTVSGISPGMVIDSIIPIEVFAQDQQSFTDSIHLENNGSRIHSVQNSELFYELNPDLLDVGEVVFTVNATDTLGNATSQDYNITVKRKLITINVPPFMFPGFTTNYVFLSREDGSLLASSELTNQSEVKLYAPGEFIPDEKFSLTFYYQGGGPDSQANLFTIYDITRNNLGYINLDKLPASVPWENKTYELKGFGDLDKLRAKGKDYSGVKASGKFYLTTNSWDDTSIEQSRSTYIYKFNPTTQDYSSVFLNTPLPVMDTLDIADFDPNNVSNLYISNSGFTEAVKVKLLGFMEATDYSNNLYHQAYDDQIYSGQIYYTEAFNNFRTEIYTQNYSLIHEGRPDASYTSPSWSADFTQMGNTVNLSLSGSEHEVGKALFLSDDQAAVSYNWQVRFNTRDRVSFVLPELPQALQGTNFANLANTEQLILQRMGVTDYSAFNGYTDYLDKIIRHHRKNHLYISDRAETVFKSGVAGNALRNFEERIWW